MSKTVIGFFSTTYDAQVAVERLAARGVGGQSIDVSRGQRQDVSDHKPNKVSEFFNRLFGGDSADANRYTTAANEEVTIVTVHASDAEQAEIVADVLDDAGAIDVDEHGHSDSTRSGNDMRSTHTAGTDSNNGISGDNPRYFDQRDRQNLATGNNYTNSTSPDPNSTDDMPASRVGPGMTDTNSEYVDERSYPGDRFSGGMNTGFNDQRTRNNDGFRDVDDDQTGRPSSIPSDTHYMAGRGTPGEDMTNDGISSPDDDQRVINQRDPGKSTLFENTENTGLETPIPSPKEQLERAKRRSRIIDNRIDDDYRLRDS